MSFNTGNQAFFFQIISDSLDKFPDCLAKLPSPSYLEYVKTLCRLTKPDSLLVINSFTGLSVAACLSVCTKIDFLLLEEGKEAIKVMNTHFAKVGYSTEEKVICGDTTFNLETQLKTSAKIFDFVLFAAYEDSLFPLLNQLIERMADSAIILVELASSTELQILLKKLPGKTVSAMSFNRPTLTIYAGN